MHGTNNMNELLMKRAAQFRNATTGKEKVEFIPHFSNMWSWKYYDAGMKLTDVLYNYDMIYDACEQFYQRYKVDFLYETGWRNPTKVTTALGHDNNYIIDDTNYSIAIRDQQFMADGEYDQLIANPTKYLWETFLPEKFSRFRDENNSSVFGEFMGNYAEFGGLLGRIGGMAAEKYGMPALANPNAPVDFWGNGYEILFCVMRGMKKLSIDLRRMPDKVAAACEALDSVFAIPRFERGMAIGEPSLNTVCDMNPVMLAHVILSPKQFERFYWPILQRCNTACKEKDMTSLLFVEGSGKRFWDCFRDLEKDHFAIICELDDVYEMKQELPNMTIGGGMSADLLGRGTPEECVAQTKKLVEDIGGEDHRYIFSTGKMLSFPKDCNRENLAAVCDYLSEINY